MCCLRAPTFLVTVETALLGYHQLHDAANLTLKRLLVGTNSFFYIDVRFSRATVRVALLRLPVGEKTRRTLFLPTFQKQHLRRVFIASFDVAHGFSNTRDWSRLVHSLLC